ncbi:MAG: helix-turn-helix transcriptional regulator [Chitinophagales bacterium]|nr:helix-turn-helix transcriptional regulator [Chitinophagales bacterium]
MNQLFNIKSISELHRILGCPPPKHPAISFLNFAEMNVATDISETIKANTDFYIISLKAAQGSMKYGRNHYDFEEGTLLFTAPNQVLSPSNLIEDMDDTCGWSLFFHPDLLYHSDLGKKISQYSFFTYEANEALHLSEDEKSKILDCIGNITEEYNQNIDQHSQDLILSNLELLLNYCRRFYDRQFYTRRKYNKDIVVQIERLLLEYFNSDKPGLLGLPSVKYCAEQVNLSPNYLSDLLKKETGKNTKEHINYYLLEKAKALLLSSELNINEIAYDLGFEYSKSFGKLFKKKVGITPKEYRKLN